MKTFIAKNSWLANSDLRLDAAYHLSDGQLTLIAFKKAKIPTEPLNKVTERIFYGGRSKRAYVNNPENGLPFIKGADIIKADFSNLKIISRKRTANLKEYFLEEGWTCITRSGTIGNTAYINKNFIGKAASDDIIRVVPSTVPSGFLYAFLTSKNGKALLTHGTYGAVIQHIEPEHIENIPIPIFPTEKQLQIHNLITESSKLRVEANNLLVEVKQNFDFLKEKIPQKVLTKNISSVSFSSNNRFNGNYHLSLGTYYEEKVLQSDNILLSQCIVDIFTSGREKRNYCSKEKGIPFLSNTDLSTTNPFRNCNYLHRRLVGAKSKISNKMLLTGRVGQDTVGQVYFPHKYLIDSVASDNIIRIVVNEQISLEYIYAFLSSDIGNEIIRRRKTGVGQPFITEEMLLSIPIPLLDINVIDFITTQIEKYSFLTNNAYNKESEAIQLIENEIEQWQH